MQASDKIINFIKEHEGLKLQAYRPLLTDRWTIGYGSTYIKDMPVRQGDVINQQQADELLEDSISLAAKRLSIGLPATVTQQQFDAAVSLAYNIGVTAFKNSDTGRMFYDGKDIGDRFPLWNRSGGMVVKGLVERRLKEQVLYKEGVYDV